MKSLFVRADSFWNKLRSRERGLLELVCLVVTVLSALLSESWLFCAVCWWLLWGASKHGMARNKTNLPGGLSDDDEESLPIAATLTKATKAKKPVKGLAFFCLFSSLVSLVACFYFLLSSCFVLLSSFFSLLSSIFSLFIFNYVSLLSSLLFSIFPSFFYPTLSVASPSKEAAVGVRACR